MFVVLVTSVALLQQGSPLLFPINNRHLVHYYIDTVVFTTYPAPVNLEPPSLCLLISFLFALLSLKEGKVEMVLLVVVLWRMS